MDIDTLKHNLYDLRKAMGKEFPMGYVLVTPFEINRYHYLKRKIRKAKKEIEGVK